jgi:hypothetical protein
MLSWPIALLIQLSTTLALKEVDNREQLRESQTACEGDMNRCMYPKNQPNRHFMSEFHGLRKVKLPKTRDIYL